MKNPIVVLTGGTGSFGSLLIESLMKESLGLKLVLLVRADSHKHAKARFRELNLPSDYAQKIRVVMGDLSKPDLGLNSKQLDELTKTTTHILHAAASTRFTLPLAEARRNNVDTTQHMINFAQSCNSLTRFGFVSTAFVAGKRTGTIYESELEHSEGFLNTYEQSKYEAELLVRKQSKAVPIISIRPSLVITVRAASGGPQSALTLGTSLASKGFLPILPGQPAHRLDIVGGTYTAQATAKILLKDRLAHDCYHITSAKKSPTLKQIIELIEETKGKKLPIRFTGDMESFVAELKKVTRFRPDLFLIYRKVASFLPELAYPKIFDNQNLHQELGSDLPVTNIIDEIRPLLR